MKDRTTIIIAHRLSTIRHADHIFVLEDGRIAEKGNFEELANIDGGIFSGLLKLQFLIRKTKHMSFLYFILIGAAAGWISGKLILR